MFQKQRSAYDVDGVEAEVQQHFKSERWYLLLWTIGGAVIGGAGAVLMLYDFSAHRTLVTMVGLLIYREGRIRTLILNMTETGANVQFSLMRDIQSVKRRLDSANF